MALEARLAASSRETRLDLNRLRRRVVFERLLVRLESAQYGVWVLKGGMALEVRWHERARATRDLDLATRVAVVDDNHLRAVLAEALQGDPQGDWFQFTVGSPRALAADAAGRPGWRFPTEARLAGRQFAQVTVDAVARSEEIGSTERIQLPSALAFAGLPATSIEIIDRRQHFAEKLHALTQTYGERPNTRTRDLIDLLMLIEDGLQPSRKLYEGVDHVFTVRATHTLPIKIPDPPSDWTETYPALAVDLDVEAKTIDQAMKSLRAFWGLVRTTEEP